MLDLVDDVVVVLELDRVAAPLAGHGVLEGLVHVQVGQRVAEDVGLGVLVADRPVPLVGGLVLADRVALEGLEQVRQGRFLDPANPLGADLILPLAVLLDQAFLLDQVDEVLHVLVLDVVEVPEDLVAVLHQVFGNLVERLLGRLRLRTPATHPTSCIR